MSAKPAKTRNVFLDVIRVFFCIMVFLCHATQYIWPETMQMDLMLNAQTNWSYFFIQCGKVFGLKGYCTIAFFCWTSGYFFMQAFKKVQKTGVMNKGKDGEIAFKYWGKTYASYAPYILYGTVFAFLFYNIAHPTLWMGKPFDVLHQIILTLPTALGFNEIGINANSWSYAATTDIWTLTNNWTSYRNLLIDWNCIFWYMSSLICFAVIFYVVFMKNEAFGATAWCIFHYMIYNVVFSTNQSFSGFFANNWGINWNYIRLMGPLSLGIWGWYAADYIRKNVTDEKGSRGLSIAAVISFAIMIYWFATNTGGMVTIDMSSAVFLTILMSGKEKITNKINEVLSKIPGSQNLGTLGLAVFIHHHPITMWLAWKVQSGDPAFANFTANNMEALLGPTLIVLLLTAIPFYFIEKYLIKRYAAWITKITKANIPTVIEQEKMA